MSLAPNGRLACFPRRTRISATLCVSASAPHRPVLVPRPGLHLGPRQVRWRRGAGVMCGWGHVGDRLGHVPGGCGRAGEPPDPKYIRFHVSGSRRLGVSVDRRSIRSTYWRGDARGQEAVDRLVSSSSGRGHSTPPSFLLVSRKKTRVWRHSHASWDHVPPLPRSRPSGCENVALDSGHASGNTRPVRLPGATTSASRWCRARQAHSVTIQLMQASVCICLECRAEGRPYICDEPVTMTVDCIQHSICDARDRSGGPCSRSCTALLACMPPTPTSVLKGSGGWLVTRSTGSS